MLKEKPTFFMRRSKKSDATGVEMIGRYGGGSTSNSQTSKFIEKEWAKFLGDEKEHDAFIDRVISDKAKQAEKGGIFASREIHQLKRGSVTYVGQIDEKTGLPDGIGRMTFNCSSKLDLRRCFL